MLEFNTVIEAIEERSDSYEDPDNKVIRPGKGTILKFKDICKQLQFTDPSGGARISKCFNTGQLIDFAYELTNGGTYNMAPYTDNTKLLEQINRGKSQPPFRIIPVKNALA